MVWELRMPNNELVEAHYTHGSLLGAIRDGIQKLGKTETSVTLEDLGPVEEFHIGGREASLEFLDQLALSSEDTVLDVGCGLGGVARFAASRYAARVVGVDLTEEFIQAGRVMNEWTGLDRLIDLQQGSALTISRPDASFDKAYMMHVGMNIVDKSALMTELHRVLKPGGRLGIFDIMRMSADPLTYPVPWATDPEGSALATPEEYRSALEGAGFEVTAERNRHAFAIAFLEKLRAANAAAGGPPPLGLHIVMGENAAQKTMNMVENVQHKRVAPVEIFAVKRS